MQQQLMHVCEYSIMSPRSSSMVCGSHCWLISPLCPAPLQIAYMLVAGTFPFNAFLAGLLCSLGFFSFTRAWQR